MVRLLNRLVKMRVLLDPGKGGRISLLLEAVVDSLIILIVPIVRRYVLI